MSRKRRPHGETLDTDGRTPLATRRGVIAAGSAVALAGLAGCSGLDGLLDSGSEQLIGTTTSTPAAFYAGRPSSTESTSSDSDDGNSDKPQAFRTGPTRVNYVPATAQFGSRAVELWGWSNSKTTKAKDLNSSRSNKPRSEWWAGPDDGDDGDGDDSDTLAGILDVELDLLSYVTVAQNAVERREQADAQRALDAFIDATENVLRPALDNCGTGVCETIRKNSEIRVEGVRRASDAVDEENWTLALREVAGVEEIVLEDIERLDDELVERRPGRPRFTDIIEYLQDEPTIGERFTVCLPDATLPGDRGSLAEELTPGRVLSYFAASYEPDGKRTPFNGRYDSQGISYDDEGCIQLDGPISLHKDISCGSVLSAELDTYRTVNRGIAGYSTESGAVVSSNLIVPVAMDKGLRFVAPGGTFDEPERLVSWGQETGGDVSVSPTLVCPVAVTPEDCPCPLPGLFYVRRIIHDDQLTFAGGWTLDEGALYDDSVTLLFEEGPAEVATITLEDIESDDYDDRIVEQFSRDRSQHGSAVISGDLDAIVESGAVPKAQLTSKLDSLLETPDDRDDGPTYGTLTALDAPLLHLVSGNGTTMPHAKFKAEIYVL